MVKEKYFVVNDGEAPAYIYFDFETAKAKRFAYIDSFDKNGAPVKVYELKGDKYIDIN